MWVLTVWLYPLYCSVPSRNGVCSGLSRIQRFAVSQRSVTERANQPILSRHGPDLSALEWHVLRQLLS